jgi:hypothetical protein
VVNNGGVYDLSQGRQALNAPEVDLAAHFVRCAHSKDNFHVLELLVNLKHSPAGLAELHGRHLGRGAASIPACICIHERLLAPSVIQHPAEHNHPAIRGHQGNTLVPADVGKEGQLTLCALPLKVLLLGARRHPGQHTRKLRLSCSCGGDEVRATTDAGAHNCIARMQLLQQIKVIRIQQLHPHSDLASVPVLGLLLHGAFSAAPCKGHHAGGSGCLHHLGEGIS